MSSGAKTRSIGARVRAAAVAGAAVTGMLSMSGCISSRDLRSHELIGGARPPISPEAVKLYLETPSRRYEQIAVLYSSSRRSWSFNSQTKADVVIRRLKEEAASLGANYMGPRGTADLGIGVSGLTFQRYGRGIAIYLPP
jgi:hypothetical protein